MDKGVNKSLIDYVKLIRKSYPDFETAYVFGSHARGNSYKDSDIDLALIFKNLNDSERFDIQVKLMLLASRIDLRIEPHPLSHADFNSENPFVVEIKRTGFELLEKAI